MTALLAVLCAALAAALYLLASGAGRTPRASGPS